MSYKLVKRIEEDNIKNFPLVTISLAALTFLFIFSPSEICTTLTKHSQLPSSWDKLI